MNFVSLILLANKEPKSCLYIKNSKRMVDEKSNEEKGGQKFICISLIGFIGLANQNLRLKTLKNHSD